ncbi:peptidase M60-like family-domain-containing protein [Aspergillus stella-maris]|uniref:peptidase M60-like family-domain-containing protein n=1 Tax=Aspergillus stella-maris TaxID=1810926 RepID=UPI003CCCB446
MILLAMRHISMLQLATVLSLLGAPFQVNSSSWFPTWDISNLRSSTHQDSDRHKARAQFDQSQDILQDPNENEASYQPPTAASAEFNCQPHDSILYVDGKIKIWPTVKNTGSKTWERAIIESPDIEYWDMTIVWAQDGCVGKNKPSVRCTKENIQPGGSTGGYTEFELLLNSGDDGATINIPLNLTTYVDNEIEDQVQCNLRFVVRKPAVYRQSQADSFPQSRRLILDPTPDAEDERLRLQQNYKYSDFQSTGFYLNPNSPLTLTVSSLAPNSPRPQVMVGTPDLVNPNHTNEYLPYLEWLNMLDNGDNEVASKLGGILYIRYSHKLSEPPPEPVTVELAESDAAPPLLFFEKGKTTKAAWKDMLRVNEIPFVEIVGKRVTVTGLAASVKKFADQGQDPNALLAAYEDIFMVEDTISALETNASDPRDRPSPLGPFIVESKNSAPIHTTSYRIGYQTQDNMDIWWEPSLRKSWGMYHELGHFHQHPQTWSPKPLFGEVTVNIFSLACKRQFDPPGVSHNPAGDWTAAKEYLAKPDAEKDLHQINEWRRLVMFEQLRVVLGDAYLLHLHRESRRAPDQRTDANKIHFLITKVSEGAQLNLAAYFTKWGLKLEQRTIDAIKGYPKPYDDYTTVPVYGQEN